MKDYAEVAVDVWGDFATFKRPESIVDRDTYLVPTPSACRGVLNAIYSKPIEFYYEIFKIEVMNPIRTMEVFRNEITKKVDPSKITNSKYWIDTEKRENMTQRISTYLRDVYYRIHAYIVLRDDAPQDISIESIKSQFERRVAGGKCFYQPYLGTRECMCYFAPPDKAKKPYDISKDLGVTLYDVFDIESNIPLDTSRKTNNQKEVVCPSFYHTKIEHGVIDVPRWNSGKIMTRGE